MLWRGGVEPAGGSKARLLRCGLLPLRGRCCLWGLRGLTPALLGRCRLRRLTPARLLRRLAVRLRRRLPPRGCRSGRRLRLTPLLRRGLRARLAPLALGRRGGRGRCTPARIGGLRRRCTGLLHGSPARQAELVRGLVLSATASADDHAKTPGGASIYARAIQRNPAISGPSRPARGLPCRRGRAGRRDGHGGRRREKRPRSARGGGSGA